MCQAGVEMFEYRLPQSPVENKVLLSHASGVPVCKPSRLNGHAVEVGDLPVSPAAESLELNHLGSPSAVRSRPNPNSVLPHAKAPRFQSKHRTSTKQSSKQGMLSRKDRRTRPEKNGLFTAESKMSFEERVKSKFNLKKSVENMSMDSLEDPDDPYAFPEPSSESAINPPGPSNSGIISTCNPSQTPHQTSPSPVDPGSLPQQQQNSPFNSKSPVDLSSGSGPNTCSNPTGQSGVVHPITGTVSSAPPTPTSSTNTGSSGTSSIAKLYPELAEKLERVKPRLETKVKGRSQGSSTVNRLQTKIAQNRIKDKLKRTHNQDVTSPQRSPVCTPSQRSPVSLDLSSAITKEPTERLSKRDTKSSISNLPLSYDGASLRSGGSGGGVPGSMPPPPPPFMGFQNVEQLPDNVNSSVNSSTTTTPTSERAELMPPPPYPGLLHASSILSFLPETKSNRLPQPAAQQTLSSQHPFFPSLEGCPLGARQPSPAFLSTIIPVLRTLPRRPKHVLSEKEARAKLKTDSALLFYSLYVRQKIQNHHYLPFDVAVSDDEEEKSDDEDLLPWQQDWFSASSDEEDDEPDDELALHIRTTKLALMRARLRRQYSQSRKSHKSNDPAHKSYKEAVMAMIKTSRESCSLSIKTIQQINHVKKPPNRFKRKLVEDRPCRHKNDEELQCEQTALPFANHCQKHIMYNVDQQLFDYCTAKFADNTQCCIPVFDIRHELPLCPEHAAKADNYNKAQGTELKSRPRKKTRPSALTKPPKKGKKKRNQRRNVRPQKPIPSSDPSENTDMPVDVEDIKEEISAGKDSASNGDSSLPPTPPVSPPAPPQPPVVAPQVAVPPVSVVKNVIKPFEAELPASVLEFPDVMEKSFELPLEQASRLLEDQDLHDVFKLPDDAFDIFGGRNAEDEPSREETEALERALAEASKDVKEAKETLEKLSQSMTPEELTKHLTATLLGHALNSAELESSAISGNLLPAGVPECATPMPPREAAQNGAPLITRHIKPAGDITPHMVTDPATPHLMYSEQQTVPGYSQPAVGTASPTLYPSKQYTQGHLPVVANMPAVNSQTYVPYTANQSAVQSGDRLLVHSLPIDQPAGTVLTDYHNNQNCTLRQQLSVTVPQSPLAMQRHLHLAGSPAASSPGRHTSTVVSLASPATLSVHSPIQTPSPMQSPMTNSHSAWPAAQLNSCTSASAPVYAGYQNGFPMNHTGAYSYQVPPGPMKFPISTQVKVDSPHYLAVPHSIGVPASQPPKPGFDKGNSGGTKIT